MISQRWKSSTSCPSKLTQSKLSAQLVGVAQGRGARGGIKAQPACRLSAQQRAAAHLNPAGLSHLQQAGGWASQGLSQCRCV